MGKSTEVGVAIAEVPPLWSLELLPSTAASISNLRSDQEKNRPVIQAATLPRLVSERGGTRLECENHDQQRCELPLPIDLSAIAVHSGQPPDMAGSSGRSLNADGV